MMDKGLYKYVYGGEIIYIGMSTRSISGRIANHEKEKKFQPFLKDSEIYIIPMNNDTEIKGCEKLLINKYAPKLNVVDNNNEGTTIDIEDLLPKWELYERKIQYPEPPKVEVSKEYIFQKSPIAITDIDMKNHVFNVNKYKVEWIRRIYEAGGGV